MTTLMIIGGIALLLPGACVVMLNPGGGLLVVLGAAAIIAFGLGRLTQTLTNPQVEAPSRQGRAVAAVVILVLWGLWLALLVFALYLAAAFSHFGHDVRWQ